MLRNKFKNVPSDVNISATTSGRTTTIRTAKVTFGPDPPKASIAGTPTTKGASATFEVRCQGLNTQTCRGTVTLSTFEKLGPDGKTITALFSARSSKGKLVTIAAGAWSVRTWQDAHPSPEDVGEDPIHSDDHAHLQPLHPRRDHQNDHIQTLS